MQVTSSVWLLALFIVLCAIKAETVSRSLPFVAKIDRAALKKSNAHYESEEINHNYRLPNNTLPKHYDIKLAANFDLGEKEFYGQVKIDIVVVNATKNIVLHARQIVISKVTIANSFDGESEELFYEYELEREFLILTREKDQPFATGTKWKLTITYSGELRDDKAGFYLAKYIDDDGSDRYLAATHFESTNARHAFPCYDEPGKRANFTITIYHSPSYTAISNMPVNNALSGVGKTVFLTTPPIPTYIVAFVISRFNYTEGILNDVPQRIYSRSSVKNQHEWALTTGMLIEQQLSKYLDVKLMTPKIDHVAIPNFGIVGMGNSGLALYREENLLYDKLTSDEDTKTFVAVVVGRLIAHQWLGNLVSFEWWTYQSIMEGLSILLACKALEDVYPELDIWQDFQTVEYQGALDINGKIFPPITFYVETPREIASLQDSFYHYTAASILHMWNNALTDKIFQKGLQTFLKKNKYSTVSAEKLFGAIQNAVEEENHKIPAAIGEMMSTWIHQGGYPILTVTRNYEDGSFSVQQEAFSDDETIKDNNTWFVPLNYAVASNGDFRDTEASHFLLNVREMKIEDFKIDTKDWLILNKQSTGFYRINYDAENWNLIAKGLSERPFNIHLRNRAQLMDDAYRFTLSNRLDHAVLLKLLSYLKQEDQYAPWLTARNILRQYIHYLEGDTKYDNFKYFVAEQVAPIYKKLGVNEVFGEQYYNKYTRKIIIDLACTIGMKECLKETNDKLKDELTKNIPIETSLKNTIFCNGLRQSGDEVFNILYKKLMAPPDDGLRLDLILSLGCSQTENQIKKFIYSSIDESNNLSTEERYFLLFPVYSGHEIGLLTCIEFLNENWKAYGNLRGDRKGLSPLDINIRGMASYVVTKEQEKKLLALVDKVKNSEYVTSSLEMTVKQRMAKNFQWLEKHGKHIMSWVAQYRADFTNRDSTDQTTSKSAI